MADLPQKYITTTVSVPEHRLAEFHEMFGQWLAGTAAAPDVNDADDGGALLEQGKQQGELTVDDLMRWLEQVEVNSNVVNAVKGRVQDVSHSRVDPSRTRPWQADDMADAVWFLGHVSPKATAILDYWMDNAVGTWVTGEETAAAAGLNGPYGVAGSLSSVGKAAAKIGRELPFRYQPGEPGASGLYRMTETVAGLFQAARDQIRRDG